jgi:hypothetical protein
MALCVFVLYGCGTLSSTVRGKYRLRAFENSGAEGMAWGTFCARSGKILEFTGGGDWQYM